MPEMNEGRVLQNTSDQLGIGAQVGIVQHPPINHMASPLDDRTMTNRPLLIIALLITALLLSIFIILLSGRLAVVVF